MQLWLFNRHRQPRRRSTRTPAPGAILDRLDDDVLVGILCFCGIPGILAASESCRHLHDLVFSQQVWLAIVRDLHARLFLDLPEDWNPTLLSTPSLVDLAKRAVCGPTSWSPRSHTQRSASHRALSLVRRAGQAVRGQGRMSPKILSSYHIPYLVTNHRQSSQLLPGGKYVLLSGPRVMCWSLMKNECVWEYAPKYQKSLFHEFAATMVDDGKGVVILISGLVRLPSIIFLDAVRLDLTTKTSQLLLHINTPVPVWYSGGQFSNLKVCSDLAVARYGHNRIVVMNLATASHVILRAERPHAILSANCIPGHIIVIEAEVLLIDSNQTSMHVWDINMWPSSFWSHGTPKLMQSWKILPEPLVTESISLPEGFETGTAALSIHISPLYPQTYTIWAEVYADSQQRPGHHSNTMHHAVLKYQLTPDPMFHQVSLDYISSQKIKAYDNRNGLVGGISFAGHARLVQYAPRAKQSIIACASEQPSDVCVDEIPHDIPSNTVEFVHMSPYSGALTISGVDGVFIYYYE